MIVKYKLQNILNQLFNLLIQLKNICVTQYCYLPNQINNLVIGQNKLPSYIDNSIREVTEYDLTDATSIGSFAFSHCTSLTSVTIPDSVTRISVAAFYDCTSLTSVTIPDSVMNIDMRAFEDCRSLTSVTIPDSVTSIYDYTFRGCTSLASITIGSSITSIDTFAFTGCTSLKDIYIKRLAPPLLITIAAIPSMATIHVPIGSGNAYKSATNWSSHADRIVEDIIIE